MTVQSRARPCLHPASRPARWLLLAALALAGGCAQLSPAGSPPEGGTRADPVSAPAAATPGMVSVTFQDARLGQQPWAEALGEYLAEHAAARLPPGQRLEVRVDALRRAGREDEVTQVRRVGELDAPRIDLHFTLRAADGQVQRQGRRELRNPAFLMRPTRHPGDAMRHEKALIDDWLAREFGAAR